MICDMDIKAVVFDMGGVLIDIKLERCRREFKKLGMYQIDDILDPFHQKGIIKQMEAGEIDPETFVAKCLEMCDEGTTGQQVKDALDSLLGDVADDKLRFIEELSGKYDIYFLSNNNPMAAARFEEVIASHGFDVEKTVKHRFYSYREKLLKPDARIYQRMIDGTGLAPEQILFIDDSDSNVAAAAALGIRTAKYVIGSSLRDCVMDAMKA